MRHLEYTRFATVTIIIAQLLAGLMGAVSLVMGIVGLAEDVWAGLGAIGTGVIYLGLFFALTRVLNLDDPEP